MLWFRLSSRYLCVVPQSNKFFNKNKINKWNLPFCHLNNPQSMHERRKLRKKGKTFKYREPQKRKAETYRRQSNIFNGFAYKWELIESAAEYEEEECSEAMRRKYANILNPSNSKTSKESRTFTVTHWTYPNEAFYANIFGKYFLWRLSTLAAPSFHKRKHKHRGLK